MTASGWWSSVVISSRNPATRRSMPTPMWRRGRTRLTGCLRSADPTPSTCRATAVSSMRNSSAVNKIGLDGTTESADDVVEYRDGELGECRVDLADSGLKRCIDRGRIAGEQGLGDVVAGKLRRRDQVAEVDEQFSRQSRILRHRRPVPADQCPIPGLALHDDLARVGQQLAGVE